MNRPFLPRRAILAGAILAVLVPGLAAHAQQAPAADAKDGTVYLSPLVNSADDVDPTTEPAATSVIGRDAIDVFGGYNLDDVLRSTAGTYTRDSPQNPGIGVNIRGLEGSGRVVMRLDGVRQNFRFTGHEAQGFTYVDPALLAGIDVSRGGASGTGSSGALAGSVNFRTLGVDDVLGDKTAGGYVALNYGSNHAGFAPSGAAGARFGDWALVGAVSKRSPDDYENADGQTVPYTGQDLVSGLIKLEYRPNEVHRLTVGAVSYDNDFTANSYTQNVDSKTYTVAYAYAPGNDAIDLRANLYRNDVEMTYDASPTLPNGGSAIGRTIEDTGTGFDIANTSRFGEHVATTYGIEYFRDDIEAVNSAAVPDRGVNPSGESSIGGVFADTTLRWGMADLIVGLRYDRFTLEGDGSVRANNPIGLPAGPYTVDRSDGAFNPKVTFALNPTEWLQPFVSWSKTFRPPTVSETFTGGNHPTGTGSPGQSFFPNPFLDPETSRGWELGANVHADDLFTANDSLRFKLVFFDNEVEDYIVASFVGADTGLPGTHFANVAGKSKVKGAELEGGYDAGFVFASLSYTHTDSDLPSQVNGFGAQSYVPDDVLSATLGARVLDRKLAFGTRYYRVSRSYVGEVNVPASQSPYEPGYGLVDLFANWTFNDAFELRGNVSNLTDKAYTPALSTPAGGTDIETGRGRTWSLTAKLRF